MREDVALIGDLPWLTLAPALHRYDAMRHTEPGSDAAAAAKAKVAKLLDATPALRALLPRLHVRPGSGEYTILSWFYAQERAQ